jgi:hypothetical protein
VFDTTTSNNVPTLMCVHDSVLECPAEKEILKAQVHREYLTRFSKSCYYLF